MDEAAVSLRDTLKRLWFGLRGVEPNAVVVSFATGPADLAAKMHAEARAIMPERRHFFVAFEPGVSTLAYYRRLRRQFRGLRIGMAPMLIGTGPEYAPLRRAAFLLAPRKILAYNPRLERHHLSLASPVSSRLFARGTPLDRIHLRPWFWPGLRRDRTVIPPGHRIVEGRPASPARAPFAVLTPYFPWPLAHGGAVRLYYLLREAAREYDIDLYAFTEHETEADLDRLAHFCRRLYLVPKPRYREPEWSTLRPPQVEEYRSPTMDVLLAANTKPLQVEYTQLASYAGRILVEHDITEDLYAQIHARENSLGSWWNLTRWHRFERRALAAAEAVVVMSEKDAQLAAPAATVVIPNGVDFDRFTPTPEPETTRRLLFIGSFRHFPNVTALRFFLDEVWPQLANDNAELTVVGGPDPELHWGGALPQLDRVHILAYVADVKPLYDAANLVIVPTLVSAGTNIKVLEAMAMERAVVSTPSGCAGLGLTHGESVWTAADAASFAEGIRTLLSSPARRRAIATAARAHALQHFSWRTLGLRQRELWRRFAPPPLTLRPGTEADLDSVERIQRGSPEAAHWPARDYLSHRLTVAELHGGVVGFAVTRTTAPGESELLNLAVATAHRGRGIGERLVEAACLAPDAGDVFLEVRASNRTARNLYRKLGFLEVGERRDYYQNPTESGIVLARRK